MGRYCLSILLFILWGSAASGLTTFTDRAAWEAAMGGTIQTESFNSEIAPANQITFSSNIVSSVAPNIVYPTGVIRKRNEAPRTPVDIDQGAAANESARFC